MDFRYKRRSAWAIAGVGTVAALICGCGSGGLGGGASSPVVAALPGSPTLGYVWNGTEKSLRPILGVPGSSQIGVSVVPAGVYALGAGSSASGIALLVENDGTLDEMALPNGAVSRIGGNVAAGSAIRFSTSGNYALVFVPGSAAMEIVSGLGGSAQVKTVTVAQSVSDAAVSDGGVVAAALQQSAGVAVSVIASDGSATRLMNASAIGGMAFAGGSDDLVVADSAANALSVVRKAGSSPSVQVIGSGGMLNGAVGVGVSRDARWVVVANGGDAGVVRVDLTAQVAAQKTTCNCKPLGVTLLTGTAVFRVSDAASGPAWMMDASAVAAPRMLFIPAVKP